MYDVCVNREIEIIADTNSHQLQDIRRGMYTYYYTYSYRKVKFAGVIDLNGFGQESKLSVGKKIVPLNPQYNELTNFQFLLTT